MLFKSLPLLLISCVSCTAGMGPIISPGVSIGGSGGGGSATNIYLGVTSPLTAVTNAAGSWTMGLNQQAIFYNLPTVTVQCHGIATGGTISNNGAMFGPDTPGTKTCGIQEALNYILNTNDTVQPTVTGGIVQLYPGFYFPSVTIYTPTNLANYTPTNLQTLILRGAGEQSTFIVYSNTTPANCCLEAPMSPQRDLQFGIPLILLFRI